MKFVVLLFGVVGIVVCRDLTGELCYTREVVEFNVYERLACKDNNYMVFRDVSQETCEQQCSCRDACVAYTWNSDRRNCYLKQVCQQRAYEFNDISGLKVEGEIGSSSSGRSAEMQRRHRDIPQQSSSSGNSGKMPENGSDEPPESSSSGRSGEMPQLSSEQQPESASSGRSAEQASAGSGTTVNYESFRNTECMSQTLQTFWQTSIDECRQRCNRTPRCRAFSHYLNRCFLKESCDRTSYGESWYSEIQEGTGGGASSDRSPERGCSSNNALPFGLENCICDGNEKGNTAGQQICSNLKAQCLTIAPFSATRSDPLVRDVQQICDNFAYEECKQAARMTVVADSTCVDILFGTAQSTRCSADSARQIWEDMTEELCKPLCPECQRL
mmetsp:Transcript_11840/g.28087  ORF Transcript_11840/g.28087 Transcript_11840/m.28087 type:complete len:387 (+) Transcript_11840:114-1274(+)